MTRTADENESSICIGCGLCCDGTLHGRTTVQGDDESTVIAAGLDIEEDGGKRFFRQPCPRFSCGSCSIYTHRPRVCRSYRCALLIKVEDGKISKSIAVDKISTAKRLLSAFRTIAPQAVTPAERTALVRDLRAKLPQLKGATRQSAQKTLLDMAVLEYFLGRWFLQGEDGGADSGIPAENS